MRILIVEDEPSLARQLRQTLESAGYAVDNAHDGEEGQFLGETESYDAVILDLGLPEIDGLTVLDRWRKSGRKMPVLVLTARDSWSDKVAGLDAGRDETLRGGLHLGEVTLGCHREPLSVLEPLEAGVQRPLGGAAPGQPGEDPVGVEGEVLLGRELPDGGALAHC